MTEKEQTWLEALLTVDGALKKCNLSYFLDLGTLLGAVREGAFIEWDNDIDLGTVYNDANEPVFMEAAKVLGKSGFAVLYRGTTLYLFGRDTEISLTGYYLDQSGEKYCNVEKRPESNRRFLTHFYRVLNGDMRFASGQPLSIIKNLEVLVSKLIPKILRDKFALFLNKYVREESRMKMIEREHIDALGEIEFYGHPFPVPKDKEGYLTCRYGDWKTPKKEFDYMKDDESFV